jgi:hypothetical protein
VREYNIDTLGIGNVAAPALVAILPMRGSLHTVQFPRAGGNLKGSEPFASVLSLREKMTAAGVPVEPAGRTWEHLHGLMEAAHSFVPWPSHRRGPYVGHYCKVSLEMGGLAMSLLSDSEHTFLWFLTFDFPPDTFPEEEARLYRRKHMPGMMFSTLPSVYEAMIFLDRRMTPEAERHREEIAGRFWRALLPRGATECTFVARFKRLEHDDIAANVAMAGVRAGFDIAKGGTALRRAWNCTIAYI